MQPTRVFRSRDNGLAYYQSAEDDAFIGAGARRERSIGRGPRGSGQSVR